MKARLFEYTLAAHLISKATVLRVREGGGVVVNAWPHLWNATKFLSSVAATAKKKKKKEQSVHTDDGIQFVFATNF